MYANWSKQLDFQSSLCGFESRHPYQIFASVVAQRPERRTVNAKTTSSILASRPRTFPNFIQTFMCGALGQPGSSRLSLNQEINGSNPLRAINAIHGTVAER